MLLLLFRVLARWKNAANAVNLDSIGAQTLLLENQSALGHVLRLLESQSALELGVGDLRSLRLALAAWSLLRLVACGWCGGGYFRHHVLLESYGVVGRLRDCTRGFLTLR